MYVTHNWLKPFQTCLSNDIFYLCDFSWQKISDPTSIGEILKQVYADHSTNIDKVFCRILEVTQHPAAAASLASILFAPQGELSFGDALSRLGEQKLKLLYNTRMKASFFLKKKRKKLCFKLTTYCSLF